MQPTNTGGVEMSTTTSPLSRRFASSTIAAFSLAFGAAAAAAAAYTWSHPRAFTRPFAHADDIAAPSLVRAAIDAAPTALRAEILLEPVTVTGKKLVRRAVPAAPLSACVPGWRDMMQGPSGRRVRENCGADSPASAESDRSAVAGSEKRGVPSTHLTPLTAKNPLGTNLVVGQPEPPESRE
jgi:hypothetical protein